MNKTLEFCIYDLVIPNMPFEERYRRLVRAFREYSKYLEENRIYYTCLKLVPSVLIHSYDDIIRHHDHYVSEGFEGIVMRFVSWALPKNKKNIEFLLNEYRINDGNLQSCVDDFVDKINKASARGYKGIILRYNPDTAFVIDPYPDEAIKSFVQLYLGLKKQFSSDSEIILRLSCYALDTKAIENSYYNDCKSRKGMFKYKSFFDEEGIVEGFDLEYNNGIQLPIVLVRRKTGQLLRVRPMGTNEKKLQMLENYSTYLGKLYTFRYQEITADGMARFLTGIGLRSDLEKKK